MKLIVGLGNPGEKYAKNRHNIGFMAVDEMARGYAFGPWKKRFNGVAAEGLIGIEKCIVLKPATYMNESGRAVGEALRFYKMSVGDVIIVHDELDLPPGTIRVKTGGGNAGHNGLKSISAHVGNDYVRIRLGIGHPGDKALVAHYVLQDFAKADAAWLGPLLEGVARGMARLVEGGGSASFLNEAVRARGTAAVPSRVNDGVAAKAPEPEAKTIEIDPIAVITAAAVKPIQPMPVPPIPVVAAREGGGGGAVSSAVILPEPKKAASVIEGPLPKDYGPVSPDDGPVPETVAESVPESVVSPAIEPGAAVAASTAHRTEAAPMSEPHGEVAAAAHSTAETVVERDALMSARDAREAQPSPILSSAHGDPAGKAEAIAPVPSSTSIPNASEPSTAAARDVETTAPEPAAASAPPSRQRDGILRSWFRTRVRGGASQ